MKKRVSQIVKSMQKNQVSPFKDAFKEVHLNWFLNGLDPDIIGQVGIVRL